MFFFFVANSRRYVGEKHGIDVLGMELNPAVISLTVCLGRKGERERIWKIFLLTGHLRQL